MRRFYVIFLLLITVCLVSSCQSSPDSSSVIPTALSPSPAASPALAATSALASSAPTSTIAPTPTSTPKPTSTPFSVYAPTVNMSFEELVGDDGYYEFPKGFPVKGTYRIIVDIYHQVVMVYKKDTKGKYTVPVRYMLCSSGINNKTPIGTFKMQNYHVRFGLFANDGRCGQYWSQINNRIYFHTILYTKKDASTYIEETYNKLGQPDSHGCVRLTVPDARWIYYNIAPGTEVEICKGSANDKETASIRSNLVLPSVPKEHIQIKKGSIPNTDNWSIKDVPNEVAFKQGSQN